MQNIHQLSENEQRILNQYHQRSNQYTVTNSERKLKHHPDNENFSNHNKSCCSDAPAKVLKTRIFNDSQLVLKQIPISNPKDARPVSAPKKNTPKKLRKSLNSSKGSIKGKSSSRNSSSSKLKKKPLRHSSEFKTLDITRIPNWKYEINKLVRTVFRHSVLCSNFREEAGRIGGLKILDEYRKYNNS